MRLLKVSKLHVIRKQAGGEDRTGTVCCVGPEKRVTMETGRQKLKAEGVRVRQNGEDNNLKGPDS